MRHLTSGVKVLLVAGLFFGVACNQGPKQVRTVFTVEGMHCDACSTSIVTTLEKVEGVDVVSADHERAWPKHLSAAYRQADALRAEIEKLGYTVIGMETEDVES